jgi:hypothetical protein
MRASTGAPPTAERRAHVQILRTLGIIGVDQAITAAEMAAYDRVFAAPISLAVLTAMAALVDRQIPVVATPEPVAANVDIACEN